jgi:hypothetical protein
MRAKSQRSRVIVVAVFIVVGVALYWISGGVMDWLRVTMHGR